jgi:hypothetical protein
VLGVDVFTLKGDSLLRKIKAAIPERDEHLHQFQELTDAVQGSVAEWQTSIKAWEKDPTRWNPFEFEGTSVYYSIIFC